MQTPLNETKPRSLTPFLGIITKLLPSFTAPATPYDLKTDWELTAETTDCDQSGARDAHQYTGGTGIGH
jgi:hypothetical protein